MIDHQRGALRHQAARKAFEGGADSAGIDFIFACSHLAISVRRRTLCTGHVNGLRSGGEASEIRIDSRRTPHRFDGRSL
ncbi:hypothetical protein CXK97_01870 [Stutzerimonas stutzeri]|nr:hypothetical protein CXK97_01870 [Stutzerimonas stutzeri]